MLLEVNMEDKDDFSFEQIKEWHERWGYKLMDEFIKLPPSCPKCGHQKYWYSFLPTIGFFCSSCRSEINE